MASAEVLALQAARTEITDLQTQLERARTEAPIGTEQLAQGVQTFVLDVRIDGRWWPPPGTNQAFHAWTEVKLTWNRVFGVLGLRMMQEAEDSVAKQDLQDLVLSEYCDELRDAFIGEVNQNAK